MTPETTIQHTGTVLEPDLENAHARERERFNRVMSDINENTPVDFSVNDITFELLRFDDIQYYVDEPGKREYRATVRYRGEVDE